MRTILHFVLLGMVCVVCTARADTVLDIGTARLVIDDKGAWKEVLHADGTRWSMEREAALWLETVEGTVPVSRLVQDGDRLEATFADQSVAVFRVTCDLGFAVVRLEHFVPRGKVQRFRVCRLPLPPASEVAGTLNAGTCGGLTAALMSAEVNVRAYQETSGASRADRPGCSHGFEPVADAKVGSRAAKFTAQADAAPGGWSMRGRNFPVPLNLTGCKAIRAWVHGDGKGQALKFQLFDGAGGYRDQYVTIDFQGWRQVTLSESPLNTLQADRVRALNFYYNSLPAGERVECLIDHVEAIVNRGGEEQAILLEDFESPLSPLWSRPGAVLSLETYAEHGIEPIRFGLLACPQGEFMDTVRRFERAAGLPSPEFGGGWNKLSPWVKRSYFFLTQFRESQFDEALAIARRGGFHTILLDQGSWCASTGHYEVNRQRFPDGIEGLARTVRRFNDAGFRVGLHLLSASIYPPDPYLTPVPDPRLVKGATTALAADVDNAVEFLPTAEAPLSFPAEDGGYEGSGTVLQVGEELIHYGRRSLDKPYGFADCRRGHLGTKASAHKAGEPVAHLVRSYGYHMYDMDTSLLDEVAANFARVANASGVEMLYFDGSERLQGDHWYYNPRMHKAIYDKLDNKNMLLQASSFTHYSWHILARSASADGHGDLKGYLDERSPGFDYLSRNGMPLDIGWYYGYDPSATPDMFEYVLGATIGYDASVSFQVSVAAAARHPFTGEILDLIARYEKLRLSDRVPEEMKARLRIEPELGGKRSEEARARLAERRREFRLVGPPGQEAFQRVVYSPWTTIDSPDAAAAQWQVSIAEGPARVGLQVHAQTGPWLAAGPAHDSPDAVLLEDFTDLAAYSKDSSSEQPVQRLDHGQTGSTLAGVTQQVRLTEDTTRPGTYAEYQATSTLPRPEGWSVFGRQFQPPLDLSKHRGIGFWLRGDGRGGSFKLQLLDGKRAMDYYIANDYTGWRYQQLARPEADSIDYARVSNLLFYYNGLPAAATVCCGIDDVKALMQLDERRIADPFVEIDGRRLAMQGEIREDEYLFAWPGEAVVQYRAGSDGTPVSATRFPETELPSGAHQVRFGCQGQLTLPVRVRLTLQPAERYAIE